MQEKEPKSLYNPITTKEKSSSYSTEYLTFKHGVSQQQIIELVNKDQNSLTQLDKPAWSIRSSQNPAQSIRLSKNSDLNSLTLLHLMRRIKISRARLVQICVGEFPNHTTLLQAIIPIKFQKLKVLILAKQLNSIEGLALIDAPFLKKICLIDNYITHLSKAINKTAFSFLTEISIEEKHARSFDGSRCLSDSNGVSHQIMKSKGKLMLDNISFMAKLKTGNLQQNNYVYQILYQYQKRRHDLWGNVLMHQPKTAKALITKMRILS